MRANQQRLALRDAPEAVREVVEHPAEAPEAAPVSRDGVLVPSGPLVKADGVGRRLAPGVRHHRLAVKIVQPGHPEPATEALRQPARHADMVGMQVRADYARHRPPLQRPRQQRPPRRNALRAVQAGIDDGPAAIILQCPHVDVGERARQVQPYPQHAGRHLNGAARRGDGVKRIAEHAWMRRLLAATRIGQRIPPVEMREARSHCRACGSCHCIGIRQSPKYRSVPARSPIAGSRSCRPESG
ncbi:hypothetical protein D9M72_524940 [compost metagenome]